jgi:hypothetical protein
MKEEAPQTEASYFSHGLQLGGLSLCQSPPRLILEIDIHKLLASAVCHDEGGTNILDRPRRREAAACQTRLLFLTQIKEPTSRDFYC